MRIASLQSRFGVLREPNVVRLATATLFNAAGNSVYGVALGWLTYDVTGSPLAVGAVLGMRSFPLLFMGLISGTINDRVHRPTVLKLYALYYTAASFGFTLLLYFGQVNVTHMLAYMFLIGLAFTFGPNARRAIYADSVPADRLVDVFAVDRSLFRLGHTAMPAVVGIVLATYGASVAFAIQTGLYAIMTLLVLKVETPRRAVDPRDRPAFFASVWEGLTYARSQPGVLRMLGVSASISLVVGVYFMVPVFSVEVFHAGSTGVGLILAGGAAGGIVGPIGLLLLRGRMETATMLAGAIGIGGLATIGFALSPSLALAVAASAVIGAVATVEGATMEGYLQLAVPNDFRGRIGALSQITRGISSLGGLIAGAAAQLLGVVLATVIAGLLVITVAAWSLRWFRRYPVEGW